MQPSELLTVFIIGFFVVITPGPNMAIVIRNSLVHSRSAGIHTAVGLTLGNIVHIAYCLVGIGLLISKSILAFNIVKWIGAGYLIYLGLKSLRSQPQGVHGPLSATPAISSMAALRTGFLTDLLNPKATLFYLALFTQIVRADTPLFAQVAYGMAIATLELCCFAVLAAVIGHHAVRSRLEAVTHWIERATGLLLIALGVRVAIARLPQ